MSGNLPILLINLDRSPDRLSRMQSLFSEHGLSFTRVPAVDGRQLDETELDRWRKTDGHFYILGPGEVGCFLSHRKCWEIAARSEAPHTCVFEDDVHIGADAGAILSDVSWIPDDADIVKLETNQRKTFIGRRRAVDLGPRGLHRLTGEHTGTAGYIIARRCAAALLERTGEFADPLDQYMFNPVSSAFDAMTIYQLVPALCVQDENLHRGASSPELKSTLHTERRQNRLTGMAKLKREVSRPFIRGAGRLRAAKRELLGGEKYGRIGFD